MIIRYFDKSEFLDPGARPPLVADDGTEFQFWGWWRILGEPLHVLYIYDQLPDYMLFVPDSVTLGDIVDIIDAQTAISDVFSGLTEYQRHSPDALNIVTLFTEHAERRGTSQDLPAGGRLDADLFSTGIRAANEIRQNTYASALREDVRLMRQLRSGINFISEDLTQMQIYLPNYEYDDISDFAFENISIESDFAIVTLNRENIVSEGEVYIRRVPFGELGEHLGGDVDTLILDADLGFSEIMRNMWPAGAAIILILAVWLLLRAKNMPFRLWVLPTFAVIAIGVNAAVVLLQNAAEEHHFYANTVEVSITEGMRATVSLPVNGVANPEALILFNEHGDRQHSRFNPVTGTIDATVLTSGVFTLREYAVSFADIDDKSLLMQNAIIRLASRGILRGAEENYFQPDDSITRTDFVSAIVMAFDLLDLEAQSNFVDVSPGSWYFHAIATAGNEGLVRGFPDGTFRGSLDIPKDQLVVIAASTLMEQMGYFVPNDIEYVLAQFVDRGMLADWSEEGIALATDANVVLHRTDARFAPQSTMTRGDAAIVLYRVFGRVW